MREYVYAYLQEFSERMEMGTYQNFKAWVCPTCTNSQLDFSKSTKLTVFGLEKYFDRECETPKCAICTEEIGKTAFERYAKASPESHPNRMWF